MQRTDSGRERLAFGGARAEPDGYTLVVGPTAACYGAAAIFFLTALGLAMFGAVTLVERFVIPWDISQRRKRA